MPLVVTKDDLLRARLETEHLRQELLKQQIAAVSRADQRADTIAAATNKLLNMQAKLAEEATKL